MKTKIEILLQDPGLSIHVDISADMMYIGKSAHKMATGELTDDDIIIRESGEGVVGITILHMASYLTEMCFMGQQVNRNALTTA